MDQPSIHGVNTYFVSKVTASTGLKAALSGIGGDELLGGYPSLKEIPQLVSTIAEFRGVALAERSAGFLHLSCRA